MRNILTMICCVQQENTPRHTACQIIRWFVNNHVWLLVWPPPSPDLPPIKNLWHIIEAKIQHFKIGEWIWRTLPSIFPEICFKLVVTMPKRIKVVIIPGVGYWCDISELWSIELFKTAKKLLKNIIDFCSIPFRHIYLNLSKKIYNYLRMTNLEAVERNWSGY